MLTCILSLHACKQDKKSYKQFSENGNHIVYNLSDWTKLKKNNKNIKIEVVDTSCINKRENAQKNIAKGKLTYFYMGYDMFTRSNNEMNELLSKHNIGIDSTLTSCFGLPSGFEKHCYEKEMKKRIDILYGKNFIDSLRNIAEKKYVLKNIDNIYKFEDCDTISRYPRALKYKDNFDNFKIDYFKNFKYPSNYKYKNEQYGSNTEAKFILHKNGSISNIIIKTEFYNPKNEVYRNLFDNRMKKFILKTKWIPATSAGVTVTSEMPVMVYYK